MSILAQIKRKDIKVNTCYGYASIKTMYPLIETHAHLDEIEDIEKVIAQAKKVGLVAIIAVGTDVESNRKTLEIAGR